MIGSCRTSDPCLRKWWSEIFFWLQRIFFFRSLSLQCCFLSKLLLNWGVDLIIAWHSSFWSWLKLGHPKPKQRVEFCRLNSQRLSYDEAEIVQNALYAQNIEVPVKALSGKLYVRPLISRIRISGRIETNPMAGEWCGVMILFQTNMGFLMFVDHHKIRSCVKGWTPSLLFKILLATLRHFCTHLQSHRGWEHFLQINDLSCKSKVQEEPAVVCGNGRVDDVFLEIHHYGMNFCSHGYYILKTLEVNDGTWVTDVGILHSLNLARSMRSSEMQCCICKHLRVWWGKMKGSPTLDLFCRLAFDQLQVGRRSNLTFCWLKSGYWKWIHPGKSTFWSQTCRFGSDDFPFQVGDF